MAATRALAGWLGLASAKRSIPVADETDGALLRRGAEGEEAAVRALMGRHAARLYAVVDAAHGELGETEDIVQETFLKALRAAHQLGDDQLAFPWLVRIGLRTAIDHRRARRELPAAGGVGPEPEAGDEVCPERAAERRQTRDAVARGLAGLPERSREVLILRYAAHLSTAEIAGVLEASEPAVRKMLQRAREALRAAMEAEDVGV